MEMHGNEFRTWSQKAAEWGVEYRDTLRERPVRAQTRPGDIAARIAESAPETGHDMETIFADFEEIIVPGMTHWQHPRFFAYFPANAAPVSVVAEYLVTVMAAQCMLWQTSPAATELGGGLAAASARLVDGFHRRHSGFGIVGDAQRSACHA
jgi:aromatic-L-amino-acid/L-tryptophan decarboxylase